MSAEPFDVVAWQHARLFGPLKGITLDDAGLKRYVVASRVCQDHGSHQWTWDKDCPTCRYALDLAKAVAGAREGA